MRSHSHSYFCQIGNVIVAEVVHPFFEVDSAFYTLWGGKMSISFRAE